jgi:DNA-directed RNA polymerase subunit L
MARQKKDGRSVNFYLDRNIMEKVEVYADENGHTLTKAVERLLEKALGENSAVEEKANSAKHPSE